MKFKEKNDDSIELVLNPAERKLIYNALRYYHAVEDIIEVSIGHLCEIMNVLHLPEFDRKD